MTDVFTLAESEVILSTKDLIQRLIRDKSILRGTAYIDVVIAGGFFASTLKQEPYKDIDVFILDNNEDVYNYLTYEKDPDPTGSYWHRRDDGGAYLKNPRIKSLALNKNTKVQYILTDFTSRKELLADFDFVHCTASYTPVGEKLYITRQAYDCIMKKKLEYNKKDKPAEWRVNKFLNRGWSFQTELKFEPKSPMENLLDEIMQRHGDPDSVLAYQNR